MRPLEWSLGAAGPVLAAADDDLGWQALARCTETDPDAFFPEQGEPNTRAKMICRGCEVRGECLGYALEHDEPFGIWGGLSERERRALKRVAA